MLGFTHLDLHYSTAVQVAATVSGFNNAMPLTCWLPLLLLLLLLPFAGVGVAGEADTDRAHVSYTAEQQAYTIYISSGWLAPSFQHAIWLSADPMPPQASSTTQRLHIYRVLEMEDIYLCMPLLQPL